jgi:hypothetical protein
MTTCLYFTAHRQTGSSRYYGTIPTLNLQVKAPMEL